MLRTKFFHLFTLLVLNSFSACAISQQFEKNSTMLQDSGVEGIGGGSPYLLTAKNVVSILDTAGFSSDEILKFGPDLRRQILTSGAAIIKVNGIAKVAISIIDDKAYLSRRDGSSSSIDLLKGQT